MASPMSTSSTSTSSSPASAPKILLAKPGLVAGGPAGGKFIRGGGNGGGGEEDAASIRSRLPPVGSLNLLSDSWDFHIDRFIPFLSDNTEFTVVGVIGPPGVGKSTIMNEIYGFDPTSPGMLPPFATQSEEIRANARHCTVGVEPRISSERLILLDTQPVFSSSVLAEMTRPDGSSTVPVLGGENLSSELAHELMCIQLGVLLASICHIVLVVSDGVHDGSMWRLMSTVDMLKHEIPDPSSVTVSHLQSSNVGLDKDKLEKYLEAGEEYMATPIFVHTKLRDGEVTPKNYELMRKALSKYFDTSTFNRKRYKRMLENPLSFLDNSQSQGEELDFLDLFLIPSKSREGSETALYESQEVALGRLRDQVLSMTRPSFTKTVSEKEWLKNSAKIWELVKNSSIIGEYCKTLKSSGLYRK